MKKTILSLFFISYCYIISAQIQVFQVNADNKPNLIKKNGLSYYLPRTCFNVEIEVTTETFIPGPFSQYAQKYLTIKNVSHNKEITSKISNVRINSYTEPDPEAVFFISKLNSKSNIQYANNGIIQAYGRKLVKTTTQDKLKATINIPQSFENSVLFTDLSVKRNFTNITDTTYKVIEIDSVFQKIPVYNSQITSKEFEQKAEEAANYIIKIRKRKFKLISGQFEKEVAPTQIDIMIKELDDLERNYTELFIGKTISIKNHFTTIFTPNKNQTSEKIALFWLSNDKGIELSSSTNNLPVFIEVQSCNTNSELDKFYQNQTKLKDKNKGLYYRIPSESKILISHNKHQYYAKQFTIPQLGKLNYLPRQMFKNSKLNIIFDINTGSITNIDNE